MPRLSFWNVTFGLFCALVFRQLPTMTRVYAVASVIFVITAILLYSGLVIVPANTVALVERFGQYQRILEPGFCWINPILHNIRTITWSSVQQQFDGGSSLIHQTIKFVSTKPITFDLPPFQVMTSDHVIVSVDGTCLVKLIDLRKACYRVDNVMTHMSTICQAAIREHFAKLPLVCAYGQTRDDAIMIKELMSAEMNKFGFSCFAFNIQKLEVDESSIETFREVQTRISLAKFQHNSDKAEHENAMQKIEFQSEEFQARKKLAGLQQELRNTAITGRIEAMISGGLDSGQVAHVLASEAIGQNNDMRLHVGVSDLKMHQPSVQL